MLKTEHIEAFKIISDHIKFFPCGGIFCVDCPLDNCNILVEKIENFLSKNLINKCEKCGQEIKNEN